MSLLNFDNSGDRPLRNRRNLKTILGIGALVGVIALGSTLAASINLNSGAPVEFGQGVAQTTACDNNILVTPFGRFINATGEGSFMFAGITLSNLDTTSEGCAGKSFSIEAFGQSGSSLATYSISIGSDGSFASGDGELTNQGAQGSTSGVTLTFTTATLDAADVYTITIQSSGDAAPSSLRNRVAAGGFHSCYLFNTGAVKCWGANYYGQLGDETTDDRTSPVAVSGLSSGVAAITTGKYHSCALLNSGAVRCWGGNEFGQLGDGTTVDRSSPVAVSGLSSGVVAITGGGTHTCALLNTGAVNCWGENWAGQLGDETTVDRSSPTAVSGLSSGVVAITGGRYFTCALLNSRAVKCWGENYGGQLGDETTVDRSSPVAVSGLPSGVLAISAGGYHACALLNSGAVKCWGENFYGQLGDGTTDNQRSSPAAVSGLSSGVVAISAGFEHTCALLNAGAVKCWGDNEYGEVGDETTVNRSSPVDVSGLSSGVLSVTAGRWHNCAVLTSGVLKCWGDNENGQLGDGTNLDSSIPVIVSGLA